MTSIVCVLVCVVAAPFVAFYCAKLGTFGALCGRRRFQEKFPTSKEQENGSNSERA